MDMYIQCHLKCQLLMRSSVIHMVLIKHISTSVSLCFVHLHVIIASGDMLYLTVKYGTGKSKPLF